MKTFNLDVDDCFEAACHSLGQEMGMSTNESLDLENVFSPNINNKKRKISMYKKLESACLTFIVQFFI